MISFSTSPSFVALLDVEAVFRGLAQQVAAAGQLAHDHAHLVADQLRIDVLVALRRAAHGGHVDAALVRERVLADVGQVLVGREVGDLGHEVRHLGQRRQPAVRAGTARPSLSSRSGMIEHRFALPQRSP